MRVTLAADAADLTAGFDPTALLIGLALLVANGFFVAAEIALLAANLRVRLARDPAAVLLQREGVFLDADLGIEFGFPGAGDICGPSTQRERGDGE